MGWNPMKVLDPIGHHATKKSRKKLEKKLGFNPDDPFGHIDKTRDKVKKALGYDFERFNFSEMWKELMRHPQRALIGSFDPLSTKMWNEALGTDYDPIINQMGGPSKQRYVDYIAQGGDPRAASNAMSAHQVAAAVASWYAGGALAAAAPGGIAAGSAGAGAGGAGAVAPAGAGGLGMSAAQAAQLARAGVTAGAAAADEELDPIDLEEIELSPARPTGLQVPGVPTMAKGGYASPAQARLMRATAHGWKKPGGGGPSRAVANEFVDKKDRGMAMGGDVSYKLRDQQDTMDDAPYGYSNGGSVNGGYTFKQLWKKLDAGIGGAFQIMRGLEDGTYIKDPNTELIYMREPTTSAPAEPVPATPQVQGPRSGGRGPRGRRGGGGGGRGGGGGGGRQPPVEPPPGGWEDCPEGMTRGRLGNCRPIRPGDLPRDIPGAGGPGTGGPVVDIEMPPSPARESRYSQQLAEHNARVRSALGGGGYAEGGEVRPGHGEGANPYPVGSARYKLWEREHHVDPAPPPPPPAEEEELSWLEKLMGKEEDRQSKTERELEEMEQARGGYIKGYQTGGLAAMRPAGMRDPRQMATTQPVGPMRQTTGGPGKPMMNPRSMPPQRMRMPTGRRPMPTNPYMAGGEDPNGGFTGGPRIPPSMQGHLQKRRMMDRPRRGVPGPAGAGGPPGAGNRVGMQDQQGGLARALQRGTGRPPMSRRSGFPGSR